MVALARAMLYDAGAGWHAAAKLSVTAEALSPDWRAPPQGLSAMFGNVASGLRQVTD